MADMSGGQMAKVYIVTDGEYSDYHIEKVFSTREAAEAYTNGFAVIEEWDLDAPEPGKCLRRYWEAYITLREPLPYDYEYKFPLERRWTPGHIEMSNYHQNYELAGRTLRSEPFNPDDIAPHSHTHVEWVGQSLITHPPTMREPLRYCAKSYVSAEHAKKLAVEAYQRYLRERAERMRP